MIQTHEGREVWAVLNVFSSAPGDLGWVHFFFSTTLPWVSNSYFNSGDLDRLVPALNVLYNLLYMSF